jgi:hypothetical protein
MATTAAAAPQAPQSIGAFGRIIGAIINPRPTFEDIARKPTWLAPILLMTAIGIALSVVIAQRVDWNQVARQQIEKSHFAAQQIEKLPPEQQQLAFQRQALSGKIGSYTRGGLGTILLALLLGAILLGLFNLAGAGLNFHTSFSLVSFGILPLTIRDLLGIPIILMKDPSAIDPQNFIASNIGAFLPSDVSLWKMALGSSVDIFVLWSVVLTAVAFSAANPKKINLGKALTITFGLYIAFTLLGVGVAALFS